MKSAESNERSDGCVAVVLERLTLEEKVHLLYGGMRSGGVERLGIGELVCADGPVGLRLMAAHQPTAAPIDGEVQTEGLAAASFAPTAFPSTLALAASFDVDAAATFGRTLAIEAKAAGVHVVFGPGVNLMRDPRGGRNFEYLGEDPCLAGAIAAAYITAMQDEGVGACAKHYYANDAERLRHHTSSNLDDRTAWEMHLAPFVEACRAGVWTIMTGNNLVNGVHISEHPEHLKGILRDRLGWDGVILTDWRAAYNPLECIAAGLTMTTGFCSYVFGDGRLLEAVRTGAVPQSAIDERARDVLTLYGRVGLLDKEAPEPGAVDEAAHREIARGLARDGMVLLRNDGDILPLDPSTTRSILLTGPGADAVAVGTGSSTVSTGRAFITPKAGLANAFGTSAVIHERDVERATATAGNADAVIYCAVGPICGEGFDLETTALPDGQDAEIAALAEATDRLVVVLQCGTAVDMAGWADKPPAILVAWYGGEALGDGLADIVSGAVSPSGKLPCTLARSPDDYPCARLGLWPARLRLDEHPPEPGHAPEERFVLHAYDADYDEGVLIGYRWFQGRGIGPAYPFGFGLSYTTFALADLAVRDDGEAIAVECTVANTGDRAGAEVVQVYVQPSPGSVERPPREMKGFAKVHLAVGERRTVRIVLPAGAIPVGVGRVEVGTSCADIRLAATMERGEPGMREEGR